MLQGWFGSLGGGVGVGHDFTCFGECICRGCFLQVQDPKSLLETSYLCLEMRARPAYFVSKVMYVFQERLTSCYVSLIVTFGLSDLIQTIVHMQSTVTSPVKNWAPPGTSSLYPRCWSIRLTSLYFIVRLLHFCNSQSQLFSLGLRVVPLQVDFIFMKIGIEISFSVYFSTISPNQQTSKECSMSVHSCSDSKIKQSLEFRRCSMKICCVHCKLFHVMFCE